MAKNGELAVPEPTNQVAAMLQAVVEKGVSADNVAAVEAMVNLFERLQAKDAEKAFNTSFIELQKEVPQIKATKPVKNKDGTIRYRFAPLEEIDAELRPLALKHGFTYSFSEGESSDPNKICKICTVYHVAGHRRDNKFAVRKSAPPGSTDTQADSSTHSYAKRGVLCDAFGIIIEHMDDDARMIGKPIGRALAEDLYQRIKSCPVAVDEQAFLKFAGVACSNPAKLEDYFLIPDDRYDSLDAMLQRKERGLSQSGKLI